MSDHRHIWVDGFGGHLRVPVRLAGARAQTIRTRPGVRVDAKDPRRKAVTPPDTIERDYRQYLLRRVDRIRKRVKKALDEFLTQERQNDIDQRADSFRVDSSLGKDVADWMATIRATKTGIRREQDEDQIRERVERLAAQASSYNMAQQRRMFAALAGQDPVESPETGQLLDQFAERNVDLITGQDALEDRALKQVEGEVVQGLREGKRHEELAELVEQRLGVAESRAQLIARDQVNKLNGQLTAKRHAAAGIRKFEWQTAGDSRVRDEHQALNGEVFKYSDPPSEGFPGEPIQCRCVAIPVFQEDDRETSDVEVEPTAPRPRPSESVDFSGGAPDVGDQAAAAGASGEGMTAAQAYTNKIEINNSKDIDEWQAMSEQEADKLLERLDDELEGAGKWSKLRRRKARNTLRTELKLRDIADRSQMEYEEIKGFLKEHAADVPQDLEPELAGELGDFLFDEVEGRHVQGLQIGTKTNSLRDYAESASTAGQATEEAGDDLWETDPEWWEKAEKTDDFSPMVEEGINEVQFVEVEHNDIRSKGVFKPIGGERSARIQGNFAQREVVASEVDDLLPGRNIVPTAKGRKMAPVPEADEEWGSLQRFVENAEPAADVALGDVSDREDFQKMAYMDSILGNYDRHGNNVLIDETTGALHAIDNGATLTDEMIGGMRNWGTSMDTVKDTIDKGTEYAEKLSDVDLEDFAQKLADQGIPDDRAIEATIRFRAVQKDPEIISDMWNAQPDHPGVAAAQFVKRSQDNPTSLGLTSDEVDQIKELFDGD